jgi:hypothetical protein
MDVWGWMHPPLELRDVMPITTGKRRRSVSLNKNVGLIFFNGLRVSGYGELTLLI